jgi:3-methyladenine DNA glycosylase Tag
MPIEFQVPPEVSFQGAISLSQTLFTDIDQLSAAAVKSYVTDLVATMNGARGFFVTFLTNELSLSTEKSDAIATALRTAPDIVAELLVKNLVMSTAMTLTHRRQNNPDMAQQSQLTQERTAAIIDQIQLATVEQEAQQLWQSLIQETGSYTEFLQKWEYDAEQKQAMQAALSSTFPTLRA